MKVKEIMTSEELQYCTSKNRLHEVAKIMKEANCGSLPVVDESMKVIGMITDRDICLTMADADKGVHALIRVSAVMSPLVQTVNVNDTISEVLKKMRTKKIGRLPVVDNNKRLKGIVTMHDVLNKTFNGEADLTDIISSGESISKTIKALNERYAHHESHDGVE